MSEFVEVKTTDLAGAALDWAVAKVAGVRYINSYIVTTERNVIGEIISSSAISNYRPSTNWAHCGPMMEKYILALPYRATSRYHLGKFESCTPARLPFNGETPLYAACRAIVAAEFGDYVMVPAELVVAK